MPHVPTTRYLSAQDTSDQVLSAPGSSMIMSEHPGINPDPVVSVTECSYAPGEVSSELVNSEP